MLPHDGIPSLEPRFPRPLRRLLIGGVLLGGLLTALFAWPLFGDSLLPHSAGQAAGLAFTPTATPFQTSATPTLAPTAAPSPTATLAAPLEAGGGQALDGLIVLSFSEQGYAQLFSHQLLGEPFTRLTSGAWDDIDPALSADGSKLAFTSNRGGNWDLYLLDLQSGKTTQFSDDDAYDGYPSWSADGAWLAYEHYQNDNLEIMMAPVDGSQNPVNLSVDGARDYAPAWRPGAQQIAFVSDRSGQPAIWLVDLEQDGAQRFRQLTLGGEGQTSPAWSPDGSKLAWAAKEQAVWRIYVQDMENKNAQPVLVGVGEDPRWAPSGEVILATVHSASAIYLTGYTLDGGLALAPELLPGRFEGAAWSAGALHEPLPAALQAAAAATPSAAWADALDDEVQHTTDQLTVTNLHDVTAPIAQINEAASEPFDALRERAAQLLGWDALSNLEHAFVPLTVALPPLRQQDWLYTGRAFSLQSNLLGAGWMAAVREEYDGQTYWRIYMRSAQQDGGLGRPLTARPWNFAARYNSSESNYQAGGKLAADIPDGYWIDFTALAADYGFERLPALPNWRSYFPGLLFNEFALRAGLTWEQAMLQLYSTDAVATQEAAGN